MKNFVLVLSLVLGSWVLSPTPVAQASWFSNWWNSGGSSKAEKYKKYKKHKTAPSQRSRARSECRGQCHRPVAGRRSVHRIASTRRRPGLVREPRLRPPRDCFRIGGSSTDQMQARRALGHVKSEGWALV